ncbi:MAG: hypothetical protein IT340_22840 [Chloroflexi bacterium]|nr:hypothetical protein [Chloroflexota bacterium]
MAWPWRLRQQRQATAARLGLSGLLPVRSPAGRTFGAIAGRRGRLAAVLALDGRRLWLDEPAAVESALAALAVALVGPPSQVLLRRRGLDPGPAVAGWSALAGANLAGAEPRATIASEYARSLIDERLTAGLARVDTALVVSAASPALLWRRIEPLTQRLPGGARALDLAELAAWLREWAGADDLPALASRDEPAPASWLAPAHLHVTADRLVRAGGRPVSLWRVVDLPPLVEVGWVRHLLAEPSLAHVDWDLSLHCWPPDDAAAERRATARALRATEMRLARAAAQGRPLARASLRVLQRAHAELAQRLAALDAGGQHLRHVGMWVAVHGEPVAGAALVAAFGRLGMRLAPVRGRLAVEHAWRAIGPLTQPPPVDRLPMVLTAAEVAPLAWWAVTPGQPAAGWPATLVTPERAPLLTPALLAGDDHLLTTGAAADARVALQSWALETAWRGQPVLALQAGDDWTALASATGGHALWLGPEGDHGVDPVAADGCRMDTRAGWLTWLEESAVALSWLLPGNMPGLGADLRAGLVETGQAFLDRGQPPSLAAVVAQLESSGYETAAGALRQALTGRWRWLASPPPDLAATAPLTAIGWAGGDSESYPAVLAWLVRRLRRTRALDTTAWRRRLTVVVDGGETLLHDPRAAAALIDLIRAGGAEGLRLWLAAGASADLVRTETGRVVLAHAGTRAAFAEPAARPHELVEALGWTPAAARLVPALPPGAALLRRRDEVALAQVMTGPLIAAAVARGRRPFAPADTAVVGATQ